MVVVIVLVSVGCFMYKKIKSDDESDFESVIQIASVDKKKDQATELADIEIDFDSNTNRASLGRALDSKRKFKEDNWAEADLRETIESAREAKIGNRRNSPQSISAKKLGRLETSGKQKPPRRSDVYRLDDSIPSQ